MHFRKEYLIYLVLFFASCQFISCSEDELPLEPELSDKVFDITENSATGTIVGIAADDETNQNLEYEIVGGNTNLAFAIDAQSGEIEVNDTQFINFENLAIYELAVKVTDKTSNLDGVASITINILNVMEIPLDGLVARYDFTSGSSNDLTGNGNNGTNTTATAATDRMGIANDAMLFDSPTDNIKVSNPDFLDNDEGTFVAWVKFTSLDHAQYIASVGDEGSNESYISFIRLDPVTHVLGIYQRETGLANWVEGSTVMQTGKYYHLVMQSDGFNWNVYIDGVKEELSVRSGSNCGKWVDQLASIDNFVIGNSSILPPFTAPNFSGVIDEILLYNRPLEECEIVDLYNDSKP